MFNELNNFFQTLFQKKITSKVLTVVIIIAVWCLFFAEGYFSIDPDFGWHVRLGQTILSSGLPRADTFSYTMTGYPFVDHEWMTDIITFLLYQSVGYIGLAVLFATIAALALFISIWKIKFRWWVLLAIWGSVLLLQFSGVRAQVLDWLFIAILIRVLLNPQLWQKWMVFTPLYFLLWVNLHGGFIIGVGILAFSVFFKIIQSKKIIAKELIILGLSLLATLLNPYGTWLYHEIYLTLTDNNLRQTIYEWSPIWVKFSVNLKIGIVAFMAVATILLLAFRKKLTLLELAIFFVFLFFAIWANRNVPIWVVISLPIAAKAVSGLDKISNKKIGLYVSVFYLVTIVIFVYQTFFMMISDYSSMEQFRYPKQLISNISTIKLKDNIFAQYGWGGYLDWKLPQKKVFVDGRMPSWRWESAPANESKYAFGEYWYVASTGDFEATFKKYHIQTVIWPTGLFNGQLPAHSVVSLTKNLITSQPLLHSLQLHGWKLVYADYITLVFEKP